MSSPSSQIIAAAGALTTVTDEQGRELTLCRLGALDKLRLFKTVGPYLASNPPYLGMAMLAYSVASIDGVPVPPPTTEQQIESLVSRLGDAGIAAAAQVLPREAPANAAEDVSGN